MKTPTFANLEHFFRSQNTTSVGRLISTPLIRHCPVLPHLKTIGLLCNMVLRPKFLFKLYPGSHETPTTTSLCTYVKEIGKSIVSRWWVWYFQG